MIDRTVDAAERAEEWGRRHAGAVTVAVIMLMLIYRIEGNSTTGQLTVPRLPLQPATKGGALSCMAMGLPRVDLLTADEAAQLHCEMLAGHKVDVNGVPESITKALVIVDTGCARSMGYHGQPSGPLPRGIAAGARGKGCRGSGNIHDQRMWGAAPASGDHCTWIEDVSRGGRHL